ncbi:hypothetical protein [Mesorhizobium sp. M0213]|uniref:hypothetical protein n=1 Tax=Mesorhizobium sp. M0213 TaxID=2956917 RepID=UPI003339F3A7
MVPVPQQSHGMWSQAGEKTSTGKTDARGLKVMAIIFSDRREAGRQLAGELVRFAGRDDVIVLALPRGGVPVGYEVAQALKAPLDVFVVRKLGVPGHENWPWGRSRPQVYVS